MKTFSKHLFVLIATMMLFTMSSCDDKEELEYNLPGTWYTEEEIDFGADVWGSGTVMTFNQNHQGTIGTSTDYLIFEWRWLTGYKYDTTMELHFINDGSYAYIEGAEAGSRTFSGVWYNSYDDFVDGAYGQYFFMRRAN